MRPLERAAGRIARTYEGAVAKGRITEIQKETHLAALSTSTSVADVANADLDRRSRV